MNSKEMKLNIQWYHFTKILLNVFNIVYFKTINIKQNVRHYIMIIDSH